MNATAETTAVKKQYRLRDPDVDWSEGCRMSHGESTWYHSTMGHLEKPKLFG